MSLLLDALKKAAADKNTNSNTAAPKKAAPLSEKSPIDIVNEKPDTLSLSDTDMDLELHNEEYTPATDENLNDTFPNVHKENLVSTKKIVKNSNKKKYKKNKILPSNKQKPTDTNNKHQNIQVSKNSDPIQLALIAPNKDKNTENIPLQENINSEKITPKKISTSEEELIELINKSNKYSRYENTKRNITISLFLLLILTASGLYFYYQIDIAGQNIYITDNINEISSYDLDDENIAPDKDITILEKTAPPKKIVAKKIHPKEISKKKVIRKKLSIKSAPKNTSINILKTKTSDPINSLLQNAYDAFQNKNYTLSENLYNKVLYRDLQNRDSLLGLSAIGIKTNRYEFSRQKYLYLLKLNPRDNMAIAGLSSLDSNANSQLTESKLKFLLKQHPDAAHLYFALGTLFSKQNKWPEAQSAYFSAWSANNKNPDYTYNLAVSLDHLDKKAQALKFYTLSLKLKKSTDANFSTIVTQKRINTLAMEL